MNQLRMKKYPTPFGITSLVPCTSTPPLLSCSAWVVLMTFHAMVSVLELHTFWELNDFLLRKAEVDSTRSNAAKFHHHRRIIHIILPALHRRHIVTIHRLQTLFFNLKEINHPMSYCDIIHVECVRCVAASMFYYVCYGSKLFKNCSF